MASLVDLRNKLKEASRELMALRASGIATAVQLDKAKDKVKALSGSLKENIDSLKKTSRETMALGGNLSGLSSKMKDYCDLLKESGHSGYKFSSSLFSISDKVIGLSKVFTSVSGVLAKVPEYFSKTLKSVEGPLNVLKNYQQSIYKASISMDSYSSSYKTASQAADSYTQIIEKLRKEIGYLSTPEIQKLFSSTIFGFVGDRTGDRAIEVVKNLVAGFSQLHLSAEEASASINDIMGMVNKYGSIERLVRGEVKPGDFEKIGMLRASGQIPTEQIRKLQMYARSRTGEGNENREKAIEYQRTKAIVDQNKFYMDMGFAMSSATEAILSFTRAINDLTPGLAQKIGSMSAYGTAGGMVGGAMGAAGGAISSIANIAMIARLAGGLSLGGSLALGLGIPLAIAGVGAAGYYGYKYLTKRSSERKGIEKRAAQSGVIVEGEHISTNKADISSKRDQDIWKVYGASGFTQSSENSEKMKKNFADIASNLSQIDVWNKFDQASKDVEEMKSSAKIFAESFESAAASASELVGFAGMSVNFTKQSYEQQKNRIDAIDQEIELQKKAVAGTTNKKIQDQAINAIKKLEAEREQVNIGLINTKIQLVDRGLKDITRVQEQSSKLSDAQLNYARATRLGIGVDYQLTVQNVQQKQKLAAIEGKRAEQYEQMSKSSKVTKEEAQEYAYRANEARIKQTELSTQAAESAKAVREGYLDAMSAAVFGAGAFAKILPKMGFGNQMFAPAMALGMQGSRGISSPLGIGMAGAKVSGGYLSEQQRLQSQIWSTQNFSPNIWALNSNAMGGLGTIEAQINGIQGRAGAYGMAQLPGVSANMTNLNAAGVPGGYQYTSGVSGKNDTLTILFQGSNQKLTITGQNLKYQSNSRI